MKLFGKNDSEGKLFYDLKNNKDEKLGRVEKHETLKIFIYIPLEVVYLTQKEVYEIYTILNKLNGAKE